jgi:outer membrane immunogenic protein
MSIFTGLAAVAISIGDPALAADLPVKAPVVAPVWSWTGLYAGINAGGSIGVNSDTQNASFISSVFGVNGLPNASDKHAAPGAVVGGQIGYNWQLPSRWLVGVEADWQWTSQNNSSTNCAPPGATLPFAGVVTTGFGQCLTNENKLTDFGTARARGGLIVNDTLWYATGGLAWGTVTDRFGYAGAATPFFAALAPGPFLNTSASFSTTRVGWTLGAGVETKLDSHWSAKLEYLYVDLGTVTETLGLPLNPFNFGIGTLVGSATRSSHITDNIVRVGLNYGFFAPHTASAYAAAMPLKAPPLPGPVWSWTGLYAGINAGGSIGVNSDTQSASLVSPTLGNNTIQNSSGTHASPGAVLGGQIGYNWQLQSRWLVGAEADWQWTSQKNTSSPCVPASTNALFIADFVGNGLNSCLTNENKLTDFGTLRARGGVLVKNTLWYATGGLAWGTVKDNFAFVSSFPSGPTNPLFNAGGSFSNTRVGWTLGAGAETRLDSHWSVKVEYLYVDLGTVAETFAIATNPAFGGAGFFTGASAAATRTSHITDNIVRAGVNYKIF